jgi:hypothetical protein
MRKIGVGNFVYNGMGTICADAEAVDRKIAEVSVCVPLGANTCATCRPTRALGTGSRV